MFRGTVGIAMAAAALRVACISITCPPYAVICGTAGIAMAAAALTAAGISITCRPYAVAIAFAAYALFGLLIQRVIEAPL